MRTMDCLFLSIFSLAISAMADPGKVVDNPAVPKGKVTLLQLEEDLRFGPDSGNDHYLWSGAFVAVTADQSGNIYVTDPGESRILAFDKNGNLLRVVADKGPGPGQFQTLVNFQITDKGALAYDRWMSTINRYDRSFAYLDRTATKTGPSERVFIRFRPDAAQYVATNLEIDPPMGKMGIRTVVYSDESERLELSRHMMPMGQPDMSSDKGISSFLGSWYGLNEDVAVYNYDAKGNLYSAYTNKYEVTKRNQKLETMLTIRKQYKPHLRVSEQATQLAEALLDTAPLPPEVLSDLSTEIFVGAVEGAGTNTEPAIYAIIPMAGGQLLVVTDMDLNSGEQMADLFDEQGVLVGRLKHPNFGLVGKPALVGGCAVRMSFISGYAYTVETREDENQVVRYRVSIR